MAAKTNYPQIDWAPGGTLARAWAAVRDAKLRTHVHREYGELIVSACRTARKDRLRPRYLNRPPAKGGGVSLTAQVHLPSVPDGHRLAA